MVLYWVWELVASEIEIDIDSVRVLLRVFVDHRGGT